MTSRHDEIIDLLPEYAHGLLPKDMASELKTHVETCPECAFELEMIAAMHEAPVPDPHPALTARIVAHVVSELKPKPSPWRAWLQLPQPIYAFGALAAAVITLSVMYGGQTQQAPTEAAVPQAQTQEVAVYDPLSYEPLDYDAIDSEALGKAVGEYALGYESNGDGLLWLTDQELDKLDRALEQSLSEHGQKI